jgi:hypothetical protein
MNRVINKLKMKWLLVPKEQNRIILTASKAAKYQDFIFIPK